MISLSAGFLHRHPERLASMQGMTGRVVIECGVSWLDKTGKSAVSHVQDAGIFTPEDAWQKACNYGDTNWAKLEMFPALFVPLNAIYFHAFEDGSKTTEFRLYGPRWNETTCFVGRPVTLSHGYGRRRRLKTSIRSFSRRRIADLDSAVIGSLMALYPDASTETHVACIEMARITPA